MVQRHADSADVLLRTAQALEPTNVRAAAASALAGYYARRYDDALDASRRALLLDPYFPPALQFHALALSALGRHGEAITEARRAGASPLPVLIVPLAIVLAQADSLAAARDLVARLERQVGGQPLGAGLLYRAYAALGDADRMFFWLERAIAERSAVVAFTEPVFDPFRSTRYRADPGGSE